MTKRQRLTNNSDESDIAAVLSGDTVFSVPYFQRPYKWKPDQLEQLNQDLLGLVDQSSDFHFLGAIIVHGRRTNPSEPDIYEVIDGQQRITTLFLYLCAAIRQLCRAGEHQEAAALFLRYVALSRETTLPSNLKLQSGKDDRAQLNSVIETLLTDEKFTDRLASFKFRPIPATGANAGQITRNFAVAGRFFEKQYAEGGISRVRDIYRVMLEQVSVVQIDVWDPLNGPKIFDALNSRQEPMTTGDLVRNGIFGRIANQHPDEIERVDQEAWQPFYKKFKQGSRNLFDNYFFPFALTQNPNLRKSDVYAFIRDRWRDEKDPVRMIRGLSEFQNAFLDLACGTQFQGLPKPVAECVRRLHQSNTPTAAYPFLMHLSVAAEKGEIDPATAVEVFEAVETFLVRRAICGHEPTGLHAVFKGLWQDCKNEYTGMRVKEEILKHRTVVWPSDDALRDAVLKRPLYGAAITPYVILQFDLSHKGDKGVSNPWIEHILPTSLSDKWKATFSEDLHKSLKDTLANLLPLSKAMNASLGNKLYEDKRPVYEADSSFKSTREFAKKYKAWNPKALQKRSRELAEWAVGRWPG